MMSRPHSAVYKVNITQPATEHFPAHDLGLPFYATDFSDETSRDEQIAAYLMPQGFGYSVELQRPETLIDKMRRKHAINVGDATFSAYTKRSDSPIFSAAVDFVLVRGIAAANTQDQFEVKSA